VLVGKGANAGTCRRSDERAVNRIAEHEPADGADARADAGAAGRAIAGGGTAGRKRGGGKDDGECDDGSSYGLNSCGG
jgi:hypothetical protein